MSLKIITDSACDLPKKIANDYDITILPFVVYIDEQEYIDMETIEPIQVYDAIRANKTPSTAQVPMSKILATFRKYAALKRPCLYLSFSSHLSGTCDTARLIASKVKEEYPDFAITIIDTLSGCLGQGLIVLEAAQMAKAGVETKQIIKRVQARSTNNVEHIFSVDDLNYLYRGGRVNYASAFLGGLLNVKPILHVQAGKMIPFQKVRGKKVAINRIVELTEERSFGDPNQLIAISHADDPVAAHQLQETLKKKLGYRNFIVNIVGSVLGCHIGLGGVAAFFVNKNVDQANLQTLNS